MNEWTTEQVMTCLENMGVSVRLEVVGIHQWKAGGEIECHQQEFINKHYVKILNYLLDKEVERRKG